MKLLRVLKKSLTAPPTVLLAGWFFSCFFLLTASGFLLLKEPEVSLPQETSVVLAAVDQQQVNPPLDEQIPDERVSILEQFLNEQDSPLATQSATMIEAADIYKFDWRLLPAIAGKESSFGKKMPWDNENDKPSHNAWGWGVYGNKAPIFSNWGEAIKTVAEGLRYEYFNEGYISPEIIMKKFIPHSNGSWVRDVKIIMVALNAMEQVASEEEQNGGSS